MKELIMDIKKEEIRSFVLKHEQPDGGFSFAETTPATLEDTYYALGILHSLNTQYSNIKTKKYILSIEKIEMVRHLFQILFISKTHNIKIPWLNNIIQNFPFDEIHDSESMYYASKIAGLLQNKKLVIALKNNLQKISVNESPLSELCWNAVSHKKLGVHFDMTAVAKRIKQFQGCDGGFSFTEGGSPSFIEETYLAVEALSELGHKPEHTEACISLTQSCRANNGGYGRQITTVPSLEATYCAVTILKILKH